MTAARAIEPSGPGRIVARCVNGGTVLAEAHATSPLRFLQAKFPAELASTAVCLVTFGGGLVDGDRVDTLIEVEEGATLLVFTQSTTKVFRGAASQSIRAKVRGRLVLLPDPVAAFKDASYTQRIEVDLTSTGSCLLLDGFTSGRAAFGERWVMRSLDLRTTIREEGRVIADDALRLDSGAAIEVETGGYEAFLTLVSVRCPLDLGPPRPPTPELAEATSALERTPQGGIVRIAASSPARAIAAARLRLRNLPDIDIVDPFASRY